MLELESALAQIRNAWIAGRTARDHAPLDWREAIGADELGLLALAGHMTDVLTRQVPAAAPVNRVLLPSLATPLLPEAMRPRFRRLLTAPKTAASLERPLIAFVAARGYAAHPADWMPGAQDDWAPDLYAPWLDWARGDMHGAGTASDAEISAETYEQWSWTERHMALAQLRARDPAAARAIIALKASAEPAERRIRLIEILQARLSEADGEYLASLEKDRSDRVQALARVYLARLGREDDTSAQAIELAAMLELTKTGLIKRRFKVSLKALKTAPQNQHRRELFKTTSFSALARALKAAEAQLVDTAPAGAPEDVLAFCAFVAETGSNDAVRALTAAMLDETEMPFAAIRPLVARMTQGERRAMMPAAAKRDADLFETMLTMADGTLGTIPLEMLTASPSFAVFRGALDEGNAEEPAKAAAARHRLDIVLPRLGLLLDAAGARSLLDRILASGFSPADPRLDLLHFNAALTPETST
jgi:hypothetical protein